MGWLLLVALACSRVEAPPAVPGESAAPVAGAASASAAAAEGASVAIATAPAAPTPTWPAPDAPLRRLEAGPVRGALLLDAGHGAPGNPGNTNWRCASEQDVMRRVADGVAATLEGRLTVGRTRPDERLVDYDERLRMSRDASSFVSLHSDSRAGEGLAAHPGTGCWANRGAAGFAILWSDEGEAGLVAARAALARAVARRMAEAGFLPYAGTDYPGLYGADEVPGVFVDRHEPKKRIRLLRRPKVPSIIVETHQAWDPEEAARWEEPRTWEAFAWALAAALGDVEG